MKSYRIIIVANFTRPWNNAWYYKTGFEKNGHTVLAFDTGSCEEPGTLIGKKTREFMPDFILHTKDEFPVEVFRELRKSSRIVQWYPDPVIPAWLPGYVKEADLFFTMSEGLVGEFRKINPQSYWLTQAFEPSFFKVKEITDDEKKLFSSDVAFVGNLGSKEQYASRKPALEAVLAAGVGLKWWGPKIPWKITNLPLIYGRLGRAYGGKFIWGEEYAKVARLSKIFLAFDSKPELRKSMSARMYTAVGCGAFYLCRHVEGVEEILAPDQEIVTFRTEAEMMDKIRFYLKDEDARKRISDAGRARVLRDHTYEVRIRQLCGLIERSGML
ncbi:MAG TPA: glycosyltransferase [Thermodesulfovibrionales bacterium]|nr:glycosyltransferase [Thermodesulfovibrionales bacterium]